MLEGMLLALVIDQIVLVSHQRRKNVMQIYIGNVQDFQSVNVHMVMSNSGALTLYRSGI